MIKQLTIQKENTVFPTQLDFYKLLHIRGSSHFSDQQNLYRSLAAGHQGEMKVLQYLEEFGEAHWTVLQNVWLRDFDRFECDLILITSNQIYVLEVKNYQGTLRYDNGQCFHNGRESSLNPFEQIRTNHINLRKICGRMSSHIDVQAAVIFAGDDHEVVMNTPLDNIRVVTSNGIRNFIHEIGLQEKRIQAKPLNKNALLKQLNSCEIANPYRPQPLSLGEMKYIRSGIYCANCHSFDVQITRFKIICSCGLHETRDEAVVRTICDYDVLTYGRHLIRKDLLAFFADELSHNYLTRILREHFTLIRDKKYNCYLNNNLPYDKIRNHFSNISPRYYYHENNDIMVWNN